MLCPSSTLCKYSTKQIDKGINFLCIIVMINNRPTYCHIAIAIFRTGEAVPET